MATNQENELLSSDVKKLLELYKDGKGNEKYSKISYYHEENVYIFIISTRKEIENYIVFEKDIEVNLTTIDTQKNSLKFYIRTNLELINFIKQSELDMDRIIVLNQNEKKLKDCINFINIYVEDFILNLQINKGNIPEIEFKKNCLEMGKDYSPEVYSKYFTKYFPSEIKEKNNLFRFIHSPERKQIRNNIIYLANTETTKKYKITGPFSSGKSMTLFKISKSDFNIIYTFLQILFEESSRVKLSDNNQKEFRKKIKQITLENSNLSILIQVLKLFLELIGDENIILILDQFKNDNINYDVFFKEKIGQLNKQNNLKIVYCSSINDNETRDELMQTFVKFKGNLIHLDEKTQEYYFYYSDLFKMERSNDIKSLLFNNKIKYIDMIDENDYEKSFQKIDEKILIILSLNKLIDILLNIYKF